MGDQPSMLEVNPTARRDDDYYATPEWMTRALLRRLCGGWWIGGRVIEPAVGDGAIVRAVSAVHKDVEWMTNDIVQRDPMMPDFLLDARNRGSWQTFLAKDGIGTCITNPPFDVSFDIAEHAYEHVEHGLALLLRLSWLEPTEDRGPWLKAHPPTGLIVMPRHDFRGNGKTDSVTSAWFIWEKSGFGAFSKLRGIDIVTKRERDELMRAA